MQTCSWAHTVRGAWGILPAWHAYKVGELTSPCICSSFSPAFVAGTVSNHTGHSKNCQGYESGANNNPTIREDWQISCVRHALANRPAFTCIQKTGLASIHYRTFQLTVCLSLKKKAPQISETKGKVQIHTQAVDGIIAYNRKAGTTQISQ